MNTFFCPTGIQIGCTCHLHNESLEHGVLVCVVLALVVVLTLGEVLGDINNVLLGEKKEVAVGLGSHCASTWNIMDQVHLHTYSGGLKYNARDILFVTSPKRLPSFMTATTSSSPETTCSSTQYIQ